MASFSDCPGCMAGNHDRHVNHWGVRPEGVIDGDFCRCTGDCKERIEKMVQRTWSHVEARNLINDAWNGYKKQIEDAPTETVTFTCKVVDAGRNRVVLHLEDGGIIAVDNNIIELATRERVFPPEPPVQSVRVDKNGVVWVNVEPKMWRAYAHPSYGWAALNKVHGPLTEYREPDE